MDKTTPYAGKKPTRTASGAPHRNLAISGLQAAGSGGAGHRRHGQPRLAAGVGERAPERHVVEVPGSLGVLHSSRASAPQRYSSEPPITVAALTSMQPLRDCFWTVVNATTTTIAITATRPSTDPRIHFSREPSFRGWEICW